MITQKRLLELVEYTGSTGKFKWKTITGKGSYILKKSGTELHGYGKIYKQTFIDGRRYRLHQLAWLYTFGYIPNMIDHIDGDGCNNSIDNLREVESIQNQRNMKRASNNTSGTTGVYWDRARNKWEASIHIRGTKKFLGRFDSKEDAIKCRKEGELKHGFHENHGR